MLCNDHNSFYFCILPSIFSSLYENLEFITILHTHRPQWTLPLLIFLTAGIQTPCQAMLFPPGQLKPFLQAIACLLVEAGGWIGSPWVHASAGSPSWQLCAHTWDTCKAGSSYGSCRETANVNFLTHLIIWMIYYPKTPRETKGQGPVRYMVDIF